GSGIGAAIASRLLAEGARVEAVDVAEIAAEAFGDGGERARIHRADVSDEDDVGRVSGSILASGPPDAVFNVAGIGSTMSVVDTPLELWEHVFAVNVRGTFLVCKHLLPAMIERGGGSIVNMASIAGVVGLRNRAAYCASKGAVIALTRAMAVDHVADGVRVNSVAPGTVDSPRVR